MPNDELLLEINEWLDSLGIDRAYRKDMKESYQKDLPALKAQLAKVKQHYVKWGREKVAELLFCQVYGGKPPTTGWLVREKLIKDKFREQADQLKEILIGGK